jgi:hypothetical protein
VGCEAVKITADRPLGFLTIDDVAEIEDAASPASMNRMCPSISCL